MTNDQEQHAARSEVQHTHPRPFTLDDNWNIARTLPTIIGMGNLGDSARPHLHEPHEVSERIQEQTYLSQDKTDLNELKQQIKSLEHAVSACLELIGSLSDYAENAVSYQTATINSITIDDDDIILARPLFFLIEEYADDDEVVARIPELQANGFGKTEVDAINELKLTLGELYQDLMDTPNEGLGRLPLQWKRILQEVVGANAAKKL